MILASGEGQLIFVVVMAVVGVINWLAGKLKAPAQPPPKNLPAGARPAPADSEEERMRRFLEALGIPQDAPPTQRPKPALAAAPKPPPLAPPQAPRRPVAVPPPLQTKAPRRPLEQAPPLRQPVERIALPELAFPTLPEFETVSSKISAIPSEQGLARDADPVANVSVALAVRRALASPRDIRVAFILREVLGPAPGLQR